MTACAKTTCAVLLALGSALAATAEDAAPRVHQIALGDAKLSRPPESSQVFVTMTAAGDVRGLLTLELERDGETVTGGAWALVSRYAQDLDENGEPTDEPAPEHEPGEPHRDRVAFVDKGTLTGAVTGGTLLLASDGSIVGLEVELSLSAGSLTFAGVSGTGSCVASGLSDAATSGGSLRLTF